MNGTNDATQRFLDTLNAATAYAPLTPAQQSAFVRYAELLLDANTRTNLTRIIAPEAIAVKHFADSLTVFAACPDLPLGATVADVGTGAGFPGLVLKIVRPDLHLTLIDSLGKRLTFLADVVAALKLDNVTLVHARAEEAGRDNAHRDRYDLVTARAVAALPVLLEWCVPLVKPRTGRFVALKTETVAAELDASQSAARLLDAQLRGDVSLTLPALPGDADTEPLRRRLLVYTKDRPTAPRFPRRPADIKQNPL